MTRRGQASIRFRDHAEAANYFASAPRGAAFSGSAPALLESEVLPAVIAALRAHPAVAWVQRVNKGFGRLQRKDGSLSPPYFWAFKDAVDVTGQLRTGQRLEVEVKRPGENPKPGQMEFMDAVRGAGGVAFVARGVDDVFRHIPCGGAP